MRYKIYDCFPFFNELELLKIRLHELNGIVDKFIITEARFTHSGRPKPLYLQENMHLFEKYKDKIILHVVDFDSHFTDAWQRERTQRDGALDVLNRLVTDQDYVIISDCDEIPTVSSIQKFIDDAQNKVGILEQNRYMYYFNNLNTSTDEPQCNSRIAPAKLMRERSLSPCAIRYCDKYNLCDYYTIPNGGWHFTFMGGADKVIEKIKSFAHTEYDVENKTNRDIVIQNMEKNKDVYNCNSSWKYVEIDNTFPKLIQEQQKEYLQKQMIKEINRKSKFYDCFIFNNELDLLEIRLEELNDKVDYFVIVEAEFTHQGKPKKMFFAENKERYKKFLHKIIHITISEFPQHNNDFIQPYMNEYYQRTKICEGLKNCSDHDMIIISDVDEIINPQIIKVYDKIHSIEQKLFYFDLTTYTDEIWDKAKILPYKDLRDVYKCDINWEFRSLSCDKIQNGGWHLSYFGGTSAVSQKLQEFSHADLNKTPEWYITDCILQKKRIHDSNQLLTNQDFDNLPFYIKNNRDKYTSYYGKLDVRAQLRQADIHMFDELFIHDVYAMAEADYKDAMVIDIGANVGCFAQKAFELGARVVHSFEPEHRNFYKLKNILGTHKNIRLYNYAVADPDRKIVYMQNEGASANMYGSKSDDSNTNFVTCISLQNIINLVNAENLVVKIDCEGAEFDILYSLTKEHFDKIDLLNVEFHHEMNPNYQNQTEKLVEYIKSFNFSIDYTGPLAGMWYAGGVFVPSPISLHRFRKIK